MMKPTQMQIILPTLVAAFIFGTAIVPAQAQLLSERNPYTFKTVGNPNSLNKAIAIERVEDGFGNSQFITTTTNNSSAVGTMTEVQAILEGDNSTLDLTSTSTPSNSGTQTSSSTQDN